MPGAGATKPTGHATHVPAPPRVTSRKVPAGHGSQRTVSKMCPPGQNPSLGASHVALPRPGQTGGVSLTRCSPERKDHTQVGRSVRSSLPCAVGVREGAKVLIRTVVLLGVRSPVPPPRHHHDHYHDHDHHQQHHHHE
eukprot:1799998-Rhodomonas_salina.1